MDEELTLLSQIYTIQVLIFDFMELASDQANHEEQRISTIMRNLKAIAKKHRIPVIAISQLNREVESRKDKMPQLSDIRQSGMIEQLADQVLLMVRPKYYLDKGMSIDLKTYSDLVTDQKNGDAITSIPDLTYVVVAKNRNGRTGIATLAYDAPNMRFFDIKRVPLDSYYQAEWNQNEQPIAEE